MLNKNKLQRIAYSRREYTKSNLHSQDLPNEPLVLFRDWLQQAYVSRITDPTAMVVATVDEHGQPWQRIVLLKHYDDNGFVFYTNLNSNKALHIKHNPRVSLLFPWYMLERQVIITGIAKCLSTLEVIEYFYCRPRDSQIGAWASKQSSYISARSVLENKFLELKYKFQYKNIPFPQFWGGFRISIEQIEFWQGSKYRLHDRFLYQRNKNFWKINRLSP